jgi:hypothetical protein
MYQNLTKFGGEGYLVYKDYVYQWVLNKDFLGFISENTNQQATPEEVKQYLSMVKGRLQDAMESPIFICGMAPLDSDDPCHDLFLYDPSEDCDSHVEANKVLCFAGAALEIRAILSLCRRVGVAYQHVHCLIERRQKDLTL